MCHYGMSSYEAGWLAVVSCIRTCVGVTVVVVVARAIFRVGIVAEVVR